MKILLAFLILIGCNVTLLARVGDTEPQIEARYGKPIGRWLEYLGVKKLYRRGAFDIMVSYSKGISQMEEFQKSDVSDISHREINALLRRNSNDAHWQRGDPQGDWDWRTDGSQPRLADYDEHLRVLTITTRSFIEKKAVAARAAFAKQSANQKSTTIRSPANP